MADDMITLGLNYGERECVDCIYVGLCRYIHMDKEQPCAFRKTVEAVPVRHGRWERINSKMVDGGDWWWDVAFRCSCCGVKQTYGESKYCPNCGADMRGDANAAD